LGHAQPGRPFPCIYFPQEQGGSYIHRALGFLSVVSYDWQGYGGGILSRLHTEFGLLIFVARSFEATSSLFYLYFVVLRTKYLKPI
jgi:hypothetical protein